MNKSIALLAFVVAGQFSLAHAADQEGLNGETLSLTTTDRPKTLQTDENQYRPAVDHGTGLHPTLTNDRIEFQRRLPQNQSMVHVDLSSVSGQTAPLFVEGNNFAVGIFGNAQVLNSYEGMPASNWFGDSADSTFVLANGSVQIVFPQDVQATSLLTTTGDKEKLVPEQETSQQSIAGQATLIDANGLLIGQGSITIKTASTFLDDQGIATLYVALLDANGTMISTSLIHLSDGVKELDIPSDVGFRSVILSSALRSWMFSDLTYETEASEMK